MKKVSIIMLAYNKLEFTKIAVNSLYKFTSEDDFDFILVNNGSSDGTREYLDSLPNEKKINFEENVGGDRAFNEALKLADCEYTVFLNNDLILTKNWLTNLIKVMESDPKIGVVVPVCNSSSNYQVIPMQYTNTVELEEVTEKYNISNSSMWEERLRLMLYTAIFRTKELKELGGLDEAYSPGGFDDDDLTCRYRRAGFKLILTKDTYVHHYGSVTIGNAYSSILSRNREIFKNKFQYDSWDANYIDFNVVNNLEYEYKDEVSILGIGESCAATILQIKNQFKVVGVSNINLDYYSNSDLYTVDLKTICNNTYNISDGTISEQISENRYDYIYIDELISSSSRAYEFMIQVNSIIKPNGIIIINTRNLMGAEFADCNKECLNSIIKNLGYEIKKYALGEDDIEYHFLRKISY